MGKNIKDKWNIIHYSTKDLFQIMPVVVFKKMAYSLLVSVLSILQVTMFAKIVDAAGSIARPTFSKNQFFVFILIYLGCFIFTKVSELMLYRIDNIDIIPKMEEFHHRLSRHLARISLEATNDPEIQNKFWRAKDAVYQDRILNVFMTVFNIVPATIQLIGTIIVLAYYSLWLIIIAVLSVFPSAGIMYWVSRKEYSFNLTQTKNFRKKEYLWSILTKKESIRESRVYGSETYLKDKFFEIHRKTYYDRKKLSIKEDAVHMSAKLIQYILYVLALVFCIDLVLREKITIGAFGACISVFSTLQGQAELFFSYFSKVNSACNFASDYYSFFYLQQEKQGIKELDLDFNKICFDQISYQYPNAKQLALDKVSFDINKGELIVIVGENGSGKTTLSKVLLGLYQPCNGQVSLNFVPISEFKKESYFKLFTMAIQNFGKYAISLADNIKISDIKNENKKLDDFFIRDKSLLKIKEQLGGYDTLLGIEFGDAELSGGEWQRIALARAIYRDSEIIVLDEPTSAIDPLFEYELLNQFITVSAQKTCIIISHRVGICKKADKILVMHHGKLVEQGSHEELLGQKGTYFELWNSQAQWYQEQEEGQEKVCL